MDEDMVERVADALEASEAEAVAAGDDDAFYNTGVMAPSRAVFTRYARAAIEAMREPTEAMLAGVVAVPEHLIRERGEETRPLYEAATMAERLSLRQKWHDLIDAAITSPASR